jgi:hypothetical protein
VHGSRTAALAQVVAGPSQAAGATHYQTRGEQDEDHADQRAENPAPVEHVGVADPPGRR